MTKKIILPRSGEINAEVFYNKRGCMIIATSLFIL